MARAWVEREPVRGTRWRRYGSKRKVQEVGDGGEEEQEEPKKKRVKTQAAWEIGHIPGVGAYGLDSWRIFCRDELRGIADGRDVVAGASAGEGVPPPASTASPQQPEWQRVIPQDKELRAYLRWRWLKDGWVWDPLTGARRRAERKEMEEAERGGVMIEGGGGGWGERDGDGNNVVGV